MSAIRFFGALLSVFLFSSIVQANDDAKIANYTQNHLVDSSMSQVKLVSTRSDSHRVSLSERFPNLARENGYQKQAPGYPSSETNIQLAGEWDWVIPYCAFYCSDSNPPVYEACLQSCICSIHSC